MAYKTQTPAELEDNLTYVGTAAIIDPAREEVGPSIMKAKSAHVQVRMITGDYGKTAEAIAKKIGILSPSSTGETVDCEEIRPLSNLLKEKGSEEKAAEADEKEGNGPWTAADKTMAMEISEIILKCKVFARAKPEDKITIITVLQDSGYVCSMTGDGVNDSLALKKADIGVAMGITGTDAAKSAANMILVNDSFTCIVDAVEEGRRIYANIAKFVYFLLSTNIAEVFVILIASFLGLQSPLVPVQILWLNLMTDSLPALALANEPIEERVMTRYPVTKGASIIDPLMIKSITIHTVILTATTLGTYVWGLQQYYNPLLDANEEAQALFDMEYADAVNADASDIALADLEALYEIPYSTDELRTGVEVAQTMVIFSIVFAELLRGYTSRSLTESLWKIGPCTNSWMQYSVISSIGLTFLIGVIPGVQDIFTMQPLDGKAWGWVIGFSLLPAILDEMIKFYYRASGVADVDIHERKMEGEDAEKKITEKKTLLA